MLHARLQILHVRRGECVLIQTVHRRVDLLHGHTEIGHKRAAFAREIVNAGLSHAADVGVWRQKSLRLPRRHDHVYEAIAEQPGTSDGEFATFRNLNVLIIFSGTSTPWPSRTIRGPP